MIDEPNVDLDLDEVDMKEEQAEIELNDKEAPFLQGKTTKSHVSLAPVLISKNPDGSLQRAAMSQVQRAKDRKDIRDQKQGRN
jgi:ATP-dependent RNA helicase DHX8/PRP22